MKFPYFEHSAIELPELTALRRGGSGDGGVGGGGYNLFRLQTGRVLLVVEGTCSTRVFTHSLDEFINMYLHVVY